MGSLSMLFEISFLLGPAGKINTPSSSVDGMVMRAARTAKLGARAGRLVKLLKCLSFIFGNGETEGDKSAKGDSTKVLAAHLAHYLSTKAAMLTIFFVLTLPLFSIGIYPEDDLSLRGWMQRLENDFKLEVTMKTLPAWRNTTLMKENNIFERSVAEMIAFYSQVDYYPYKLQGYASKFLVEGQQVLIPGDAVHGVFIPGSSPNRLQNIVRQDVTECGFIREGCSGQVKASIYFDFTKPHQFAAVMDALTIITMIGAMFGMSFALMHTVNRMVLDPLERILRTLRESASYILVKALRSMEADTEADQAEERENDFFGDTSELNGLESVFRKLRTIIDIHTQTQVVDAATMAVMDDESKGVIVDMMQIDNRRKCRKSVVGSGRMETLPASAVVVQDLPVEMSTLNSFNLHILELERPDQGKVVSHIVFDSTLGRASSRKYTNEAQFRKFHDAVAAGYTNAPYHCYAHACDICYTVYRLMDEVRAPQWLLDLDQFAMSIAALCHDLGHEGLTNPFLVETRHTLALRYNDQSPLENMHCASLFSICSNGASNVFSALSATEYKHVRKVCVSSILHTDNAHHFEMVKTIRAIFELQSHTCDFQAKNWHCSDKLEPQYVEEVLEAHASTWLELILHLADVSNPLRPFNVCHAWAWRVLDEFFAQGDQEKKLGLPVGMLNDRDKINRPHSQHGFIKFLVAPFAFTCVRIFPSWHPLASHMAGNLQQWRELWVKDASPSLEDTEACDADIFKIKTEAEELVERCPAQLEFTSVKVIQK